MSKKPWKVITEEGRSGEIKVYGNHHYRPVDYAVPDWNEETGEEEACFKHKGNTYFLSEFVNIHNKVHNPNPPEWMKEFDGYMSDSYFSGLLIKLSECGEGVKVYTYIS